MDPRLKLRYQREVYGFFKNHTTMYHKLLEFMETGECRLPKEHQKMGEDDGVNAHYIRSMYRAMRNMKMDGKPLNPPKNLARVLKGDAVAESGLKDWVNKRAGVSMSNGEDEDESFMDDSRNESGDEADGEQSSSEGITLEGQDDRRKDNQRDPSEDHGKMRGDGKLETHQKSNRVGKRHHSRGSFDDNAPTPKRRQVEDDKERSLKCTTIFMRMKLSLDTLERALSGLNEEEVKVIGESMGIDMIQIRSMIRKSTIPASILVEKKRFRNVFETITAIGTCFETLRSTWPELNEKETDEMSRAVELDLGKVRKMIGSRLGADEATPRTIKSEEEEN